MLAVAARLHRYSSNNLILIAMAHAAAYREGRVATPTPRYIAGFNTWKLLGRTVDKGQKGYAILAPVPRTVRVAVTGTGPGSARRVLAGDDQPGPSERVETEKRLGWKIEHVFDVEQTSGQPLPEPPRPKPLTGHAPDGLIAELTREAVAREFTVSHTTDPLALFGADGVTRFDAKTITLRGGLSDAAVATTMIHELGHVLLHDPSRDVHGAAAHRGIGEVEAESVAYIVAAAHGLDTAGESLPYVATWAGGRTPADVVQATAHRVISAAHELLGSLRTDQLGDGAPPGIAAAIEARDRARAANQADVTLVRPGLNVGV